MSTKTTFKRIALVAVAALGLGVLSVAPSSAAVSGLSVTVSNGTASVSKSDSTTAATITVTGLIDANSDSISVAFIAKDITANSSAVARLSYLDSTSVSSGATTNVKEDFNSANNADRWAASVGGTADSKTAANTQSAPWVLSATAQSAYVGAKFGLALESTTTSAGTAGTFTYTVVVKTYDAGTLKTSTATDVSITVAAAASASKTADPAQTTAYLNKGTSYTTPSDSAVAVVATAAATAHATLRVQLYNADGNASNAQESVTVTLTGPGLVCSTSNTVCGKSLTTATTGYEDFSIRADGTAGTASIVAKTTTVTFPAKTVTFFAKAAKTITASTVQPVISTASTSGVVYATAVDADGNNWGGAAYIYATSAAAALIAGSETPVACTYNAAKLRHECPVAGTLAGTAEFKVIDASTVALATATSNAVSVRVTSGTPATVKLAFDKATYGPGEKALLTVTILDGAGLAFGAKSVSNALASGGITTDIALGSQSATITGTDITLSGLTSAADNLVAGSQTFVVYMPLSTGTVTATATGGAGVAAAGRVAVTATASVVNSSVDAATDAANEATDAANAATDAALAAADAADAATAAAQDASDAVAALSATVAKLVASLKAQITSLTNLVIKIQKKVRA